MIMTAIVKIIIRILVIFFLQSIHATTLTSALLFGVIVELTALKKLLLLTKTSPTHSYQREPQTRGLSRYWISTLVCIVK